MSIGRIFIRLNEAMIFNRSNGLDGNPEKLLAFSVKARAMLTIVERGSISSPLCLQSETLEIDPRYSEAIKAIGCMIAVPTIANYLGVRSGANLCTLLTVTKLLPLGLLIVLGVFRFSSHFQMIHTSEIAHPGLSAWLSALLLLLFAYGGYEDSLAPTGEVQEPRKTIPFSLATGLLVCATVYALLQFVIVAAIGTMATDRPLVEVATMLIGRGGALFVAIAVMISTYGYVAGSTLNAPRAAYVLVLDDEQETVKSIAVSSPDAQDVNADWLHREDDKQPL